MVVILVIVIDKGLILTIGYEYDYEQDHEAFYVTSFIK
jgi:hypothetical protein